MKNPLPFKALTKTRLYEEVADQIKQAIFNGQLKPGDRLPSERELCRIFKVGRPTIREALRTLTVMGLLETNRGFKGSVIKESDIAQYMEAMREQLSWLIRADRNTLKELWEVRKYIELGIAQSAAVHASEEDIEKLEVLIRKMEACGADMDAYFALAVEFHEQLALATGNKIFYLIWEMLNDILLKGYEPILSELFPEGPANLLRANKVLMAAVRTRDPGTIDRAVEMHTTEEKFPDAPADQGMKTKSGIFER